MPSLFVLLSPNADAKVPRRSKALQDPEYAYVYPRLFSDVGAQWYGFVLQCVLRLRSFLPLLDLFRLSRVYIVGNFLPPFFFPLLSSSCARLQSFSPRDLRLSITPPLIRWR